MFEGFSIFYMMLNTAILLLSFSLPLVLSIYIYSFIGLKCSWYKLFKFRNWKNSENSRFLTIFHRDFSINYSGFYSAYSALYPAHLRILKDQLPNNKKKQVIRPEKCWFFLNCPPDMAIFSPKNERPKKWELYQNSFGFIWLG